ncbi:MAG: hypothetical protein IKN81_11385 [Oscillospiraceae bacterium]|nr:hypothetical protein [Oscillospiraceae bacterium]
MRTTVRRFTAMLFCLLLCMPSDSVLAIILPPISPVAEQNSVKYWTLADAIAAAPDGGSLRLLSSTSDACQVSKRLTVIRNGKNAPNLSAGVGYVMAVTDDAYQFFAEGFSAFARKSDDCYIIEVAYHLNPFEDGENGTVLAACYGSEGQMVGTAFKELVPQANGEVQLTIHLGKSAETIRVFLLDNHFSPMLSSADASIDLIENQEPESTEIMP